MKTWTKFPMNLCRVHLLLTFCAVFSYMFNLPEVVSDIDGATIVAVDKVGLGVSVNFYDSKSNST